MKDWLEDLYEFVLSGVITAIVFIALVASAIGIPIFIGWVIWEIISH